MLRGWARKLRVKGFAQMGRVQGTVGTWRLLASLLVRHLSCQAPKCPKPPSSKVLLEERAGATTMLCLPSPKCPHLGRLLGQGR